MPRRKSRARKQPKPSAATDTRPRRNLRLMAVSRQMAQEEPTHTNAATQVPQHEEEERTPSKKAKLAAPPTSIATIELPPPSIAPPTDMLPSIRQQSSPPEHDRADDDDLDDDPEYAPAEEDTGDVDDDDVDNDDDDDDDDDADGPSDSGSFTPRLIKCTHPGCKKFFAKKPSFQKHLKKVHGTEGTFMFSCETCGKPLTSNAALKYHKRQNVCKKWIRRQAALEAAAAKRNSRKQKLEQRNKDRERFRAMLAEKKERKKADTKTVTRGKDAVQSQRGGGNADADADDGDGDDDDDDKGEGEAIESTQAQGLGSSKKGPRGARHRQPKKVNIDPQLLETVLKEITATTKAKTIQAAKKTFSHFIGKTQAPKAQANVHNHFSEGMDLAETRSRLSTLRAGAVDTSAWKAACKKDCPYVPAENNVQTIRTITTTTSTSRETGETVVQTHTKTETKTTKPFALASTPLTADVYMHHGSPLVSPSSKKDVPISPLTAEAFPSNSKLALGYTGLRVLAGSLCPSDCEEGVYLLLACTDSAEPPKLFEQQNSGRAIMQLWLLSPTQKDTSHAAPTLLHCYTIVDDSMGEITSFSWKGVDSPSKSCIGLVVLTLTTGKMKIVAIERPKARRKQKPAKPLLLGFHVVAELKSPGHFAVSTAWNDALVAVGFSNGMCCVYDISEHACLATAVPASIEPACVFAVDSHGRCLTWLCWRHDGALAATGHMPFVAVYKFKRTSCEGKATSVNYHTAECILTRNTPPQPFRWWKFTGFWHSSHPSGPFIAGDDELLRHIGDEASSATASCPAVLRSLGAYFAAAGSQWSNLCVTGGSEGWLKCALLPDKGSEMLDSRLTHITDSIICTQRVVLKSEEHKPALSTTPVSATKLVVRCDLEGFTTLPRHHRFGIGETTDHILLPSSLQALIMADFPLDERFKNWVISCSEGGCITSCDATQNLKSLRARLAPSSSKKK